MAKPLEYNATLVERVDITPALATFKIRPDEPVEADPPFVPGQYMTLGMNNEAQPELGSVRRPMSIVSAPEEEGVYEFYIRFVSHPESVNPLTHLLWKTSAGDRLFTRTKAVGRFTIDHTIGADDTRLRILVAAGTGLAPFVSMVRSEVLRDPQVDLSRWVILHGASYPDDLGYRAEMEALSANNGLHYFCTISRPKEAARWQGDEGRVEDYFSPEKLARLEERLGSGKLGPSNSTVFICGLTGTIGQTILRLNDRGFVPETKKLRRALEVPEEVPSSLFFEQYDSTPVIPLDDEKLMDHLRADLRAALDPG